MKSRLLFSLSVLILMTSCTSFKKMLMITGDNPVEVTEESLTTAKKLYLKNCVQCHGQDGSGSGELVNDLPERPANLIELAKTKSANTFAANIYYGKNLMPSFKESLSEKEIWQLANYVKSFASQERIK